MLNLSEWFELNRSRLERAGFNLKINDSDGIITAIGESADVVFQMTEWPGGSIEFHAMSYAEDKVIPVELADSRIDLMATREYYISKLEEYMNRPGNTVPN